MSASDRDQGRFDRERPPTGGRDQRPPQGDSQGPVWRRTSRTLLFWILLLLLSISIFQFFNRSRRQEVTITYTEFRQQLNQGNVSQVTIVDKDIRGELKGVSAKVDNGKVTEFDKFYVHLPFEMPELVNELEAQEVTIIAEPRTLNWFSILLSGLPWILLVGIWLTGFQTVHWFLYLVPAFFLIAAAVGICPGLLFAQKLVGKD